MKCLLGIDPEKTQKCKPSECASCGWEAAELADVIIRVLDYCAYAGIDIENVLEVKHEYNKSRPYRHGGKKC